MKASHGVEKSVAQFTNKVFGGWDYCIKESRAANHKKKVIGGALAVSKGPLVMSSYSSNWIYFELLQLLFWNFGFESLNRQLHVPTFVSVFYVVFF